MGRQLDGIVALAMLVATAPHATAGLVKSAFAGGKIKSAWVL